MLLERTVIRRLYGRPLETLLATWGLSLILIQAARVIFGAQNVEVANPVWMSGGVELMAGLVLPWNRIVIIGFSLFVLALMWALMQKTRLGLFVRAVTQNRAMAGCVGVPTGRIDTLAFGLGAGIAGLGGVALSQIANVGPDMGQGYIVDSFMVVVLGGVGQLAGAAWAALGLGVVDQVPRRLVGRGAGQDHGAGLHHHLHPETPAGFVRAQRPLRRELTMTRPLSSCVSFRHRRAAAGSRWRLFAVAALVADAAAAPVRCRRAARSMCRPTSSR